MLQLLFRCSCRQSTFLSVHILVRKKYIYNEKALKLYQKHIINQINRQHNGKKLNELGVFLEIYCYYLAVYSVSAFGYTTY